MDRKPPITVIPRPTGFPVSGVIPVGTRFPVKIKPRGVEGDVIYMPPPKRPKTPTKKVLQKELNRLTGHTSKGWSGSKGTPGDGTVHPLLGNGHEAMIPGELKRSNIKKNPFKIRLGN